MLTDLRKRKIVCVWVQHNKPVKCQTKLACWQRASEFTRLQSAPKAALRQMGVVLGDPMTSVSVDKPRHVPSPAVANMASEPAGCAVALSKARTPSSAVLGEVDSAVARKTGTTRGKEAVSAPDLTKMTSSSKQSRAMSSCACFSSGAAATSARASTRPSASAAAPCLSAMYRRSSANCRKESQRNTSVDCLAFGHCCS